MAELRSGREALVEHGLAWMRETAASGVERPVSIATLVFRSSKASLPSTAVRKRRTWWPPMPASSRGKTRLRQRPKSVKQVCIPNRSAKSLERKREQKKRWFRNGQKWRTGSEGRISVVKRRHGLNRSRYRGEAGIKRWVGLGVIADTLVNISRAMAKQPGHGPGPRPAKKPKDYSDHGACPNSGAAISKTGFLRRKVAIVNFLTRWRLGWSYSTDF